MLVLRIHLFRVYNSQHESDINRMNGQLANHIKIFKDVNKKTENPDASLIHYSDCKTAEQKF